MPLSPMAPDTAPATPGTSPITAWAAGRWAWWRLVILLYLGYAGLRHLADPSFRSIFGGIDFGAHELGHLVFAFFGEFASVAGGTVFQLLLPVGAAALLFPRRDYFGIAVAVAWLGLSLFSVAEYVADARVQQLTLLGFAPDPIHDWEYLLSRLHLLEYDTRLAQLIRLGAGLTVAAGIGFGAVLCRLMVRHRVPREGAA